MHLPRRNRMTDASMHLPAGMKISPLLFRLRYWLLGLLVLVGFWSPWERMGNSHPGTTWLFLAGALARYRVLPIAYSSTAVMGLAVLLAMLAAMLRTWAVACGERDPASSTQAPALFLGLWLHMLALSVLMPPVGALFFLVAVTVAVPLIFHAAGSVARVTNRTRPTPDRKPCRWGRASLQEIYFWGVAVTYIGLAGRYNVTLLEQGVLVSIGVSAVLHGWLRPASGDL